MTPRKRKSNISNGLSDEQRENLTMRDFMGLLTADEVQVARKHGILRWDLWRKCSHINVLGDDFVSGVRRAPVYKPDGSIDFSSGGKSFIVNSHEEYFKIVEKH